MASTWDTLGGQMGYNSLGNIAFFGVACMFLQSFKSPFSMMVVLVNTPQRWGLLSRNLPMQNIFMASS